MTRTLSLFLVLVAACGGGESESKPKPLKYHLEDAAIVQVPTEQKTAMLQAQSDYNRAKADEMKAQADLAGMKNQIDNAKNEKGQAKIQKGTADNNKKAAEDSKDENKINDSKREERVADLTLRAADKKVDLLKAQKKWLKKFELYTEENLYAAEARYELAKANVARQNNIAPKDFAYQAFVDQDKDRSQRAQRAKVIADREHEKLAKKQEELAAARKDLDEARGTTASPTSTAAAPAKK